MGAFLSGLMGSVSKKIDSNVAQADELKKAKRDSYSKIAMDPNSPPELKDWAWGEYQKGLDPDSKKKFGTLQPLLDHLSKRGGKQQQGAPQQGGQQPMSEQPPGGPVKAPGPLSPSLQTGGQQQPMSEQGPVRAPQGPFSAAASAQTARDRADKTFKTDEKIRENQAKPKAQKFVGVERTGDDPATGKPYEGAWIHTVNTDGTESWEKQAAKTTTSGVPRVLGHLSATDAKGEQARGAKFKDEAGNELNADDLPEGMALATVSQGGKTFQVPISQNQTHFAVGGKMYAVGTLNQTDLGKGAGAELGPSRVGTQSSRGVQAVVNGQPVVQQIPSSTTPMTPGVTGRPTQGQAPAAAPAPHGQAPAASQQKAPGMLTPGNIDLNNRPVVKNPDGTSSTVSTMTIEEDGKTILLPTIVNGKRVSEDEAIKHYHDTGEQMGIFDSEKSADAYDRQLHNKMGWNGKPGSAQDKWQHGQPQQTQASPGPVRAPSPGNGLPPGVTPLAGVPPAQYQKYLGDFRTLRTASTQLFGDPTQPNLKGLDSYADLADNKGSQQRLGQALRLTMQGLDQNTEGGHASAGGGGVSLGLGGVSTWVQNQLGMKPAIADQQTKMMQKAIGSLTPEELQAYNSTVAGMEAVVGLRKLTGAPASQASVNAIKDMLPMIGVNTFSSSGFQDKMQKVGAEVAGGAQGIPASALDPQSQQVMQAIKNIPNRSKAGAGPAKAPAKKGAGSETDLKGLSTEELFQRLTGK